ncbi:WW domain-containing oxidoreductase [Colletotrichum sidae]|uniref:WW domain-containing oxidoreductase n=1 Tax=Colletotrichum sidae TaxID=1347389 RepID=A0A4R8T5S2_9PEZI|nr:WW domain-containing oxidoreductase [Colletotrichum sidae]
MSKYASFYDNPQGPGDARPTALQILEDEGLIGDKLRGKTILVTGANQGIGFETARALHAAGATVFLGVRDLANGQQAICDIQASSESPHPAPLHLLSLSLDSSESVKRAADTFLQQSEGKLNILILNAGVMGLPAGATEDGYETHFAVNYLGHFLLFHVLKNSLLHSSTPTFNSRVVALTSTAHRLGEVRFDDYNFTNGPYHPMRAYGQSKTANIYLANEIDRRYGSRGLHAVSVHPGSVLTTLTKHMDDEPLKLPEDWDDLRVLMTPAQGAATTVYAAVSAEWEGKGGRYLAQCVEQGPARDASSYTEMGYAAWAFDEEKASRLWEESCRMAGVGGAQ